MMCPLSGEERPGAPHARPVEGRAVRVLAVAVVRVAMPHRTGGGLDLQEGVDDADGVDDPRIVGGTQAEPDQGQRVCGDDLLREPARLVRRPVLDGDEVVALLEVGGATRT